MSSEDGRSADLDYPPSASKRKFDADHVPPPSRRPTGFSPPILNNNSGADKNDSTADGSGAAPPSYNNVPPKDEFQMAKQRAQELAALYTNMGPPAPGADAIVKRLRTDDSGDDRNGDHAPRGFSVFKELQFSQATNKGKDSGEVVEGLQGEKEEREQDAQCPAACSHVCGRCRLCCHGCYHDECH